MNLALRLTAIGGATLLGGCVALGRTSVTPKPADLAMPAAWRGADPSTATGAEMATWWRRLDDPLLVRLIARAVEASPDVESARAKLAEARARRRLAAAERMPTLTGSAAAQRTERGKDTVGSVDLYDAGFDASWEPDLFGGRRHALEGARADEEAAVADLRDVRVTLAAEVARTYVEAHSLEGRLEIARKNLASQAETLELTEWKARAGLATALDSEQARTNVEQTRATIPTLETSLAEAEHRLAVLLGEAPGSLRKDLSRSASVPRIPAPLTIGIPADVLRQRPDVAAAERALVAEIARVGAAEAARCPRLTLSGTLGVEAVTLAALTNGSSLVASAAGSLAQTIFDGGRVDAEIEVQNAIAARALAAYRAAVLGALEDVENALVSLANEGTRVRALESALDSGRNAALLARQRYTSGVIDFQTLLDAERTILSLEDDLSEARAAGTIALIRLYKALGGGWSPAEDESLRPEATRS